VKIHWFVRLSCFHRGYFARSARFVRFSCWAWPDYMRDNKERIGSRKRRLLSSTRALPKLHFAKAFSFWAGPLRISIASPSSMTFSFRVLPSGCFHSQPIGLLACPIPSQIFSPPDPRSNTLAMVPAVACR
jgi:hypothetical protein